MAATFVKHDVHMDMQALKRTDNTARSRRKLNRAAFLQYTILFCILVVGIYGILIIHHKSFIQDGDGIKQGYFWTVELKHQMEMLFAGEGLQQWSWSRVLGMSVQTSRYWDPFNWIAAAFPVGYIELGYTVSVLLRLYCGGLAFLALMRYVDLGVFASVFGAAVYTFSGYNIVAGLVYTDLLMNAYLFPLIVMSVDMIYRRKSPAFFSLIVGLYLMSNFYQAYMAAISIILYIILRYFSYRPFEIKDYTKTIGKFILYGIIGICVGSIQFLPDFASMSMASTESVSDRAEFLFKISRLSKKLIGTGEIDTLIIGWTLIVIMLLAISVVRLSLKKTQVLMTILLFAGTMIPIVCSVYNCFSYPSLRWIFALELFAVWSAAEVINDPQIINRRDAGLACAALVLTAVITLGANYGLDLGMDRTAILFIAIQLMGGIAFAVLLIVNGKHGQLNSLSKAMILVILTVSLSSGWTVSFINNKSELYRNNQINKMLEMSTQRAGALIEDESFYRVDQVDSVLYSHRVNLPPNETLWWQTRSIYGYNSRIPSDLLEFNRLMGNNYGYSKRVGVVSNDNRTGQDYLCGVKYFLGDDTENGINGSDEYAGYGFEDYGILDGVRVFRSKYDVSLGYVFDQYIAESEIEKLEYAEREQAILQAVVLPDNTDIPALQKVTADDIRTAVRDIKYAVSETDGVTLTEETIVVDKSDGSITLELGNVEDSQLIISITGLLRNAAEGQSKSFELQARNEYIKEIANNEINNQTIPGIRDYNLNLGYYEHYSDGKIKISFSAPGTYTYDKITFTAMDTGLFDTCIGELEDRRYNISTFSDTMIEGSVDCENDGILFLSILEPERWECYIDGEKTETIKNTDIAFTGVEIPEGHHTVRLRYNNRMARIGAMLSVAALAVLLAGYLIRRNESRKENR